ncbi:MAG TPA: hypothetical protein EYM74_05590 [Candidatus Marinimicrobia bacterium]|nr:hypothetical protein [Candidatus Neomarinimicrobiota bacterium]
MKDDVYLSLFRVLDSEQQIITRTDQKAFTMLSLMGVFMVFFLVHFTKIQINWFNFIMLMLYLVSAILALIQLILVINPRISKAEDREDLPEINATYFKGIVSFKSAAEYGKYLRNIMGDDTRAYTMFANQVYSVAQINDYKNGHMQLAIKFFAVAIISELLIVMSVAYSRSLPFLFGN